MQVRLNQYGRMSDGVHLAADVYLPDGPGPFPVVLSRTPYGKAGPPEMNDFPGFAKRFSERGYAFVVQDCRGRFESEGHFEPLFDETRDGGDTLDWVANQSWCNGRIGLWGRSYMGMVQVPAASHGHEALRAIVPSVSSGSFFRDWIRYDGMLRLRQRGILVPLPYRRTHEYRGRAFHLGRPPFPAGSRRDRRAHWRARGQLTAVGGS